SPSMTATFNPLNIASRAIPIPVIPPPIINKSKLSSFIESNACILPVGLNGWMLIYLINSYFFQSKFQSLLPHRSSFSIFLTFLEFRFLHCLDYYHFL